MITFNVNPEKRIVVAVNHDNANGIISNLVSKITDTLIRSGLIHIDYMSTYKIARRYIKHMEKARVAIAKCHPDDVFDEEIGKQIAIDRIHKQVKAVIKTIIADVRNVYLKESNHFLRTLDKMKETRPIKKKIHKNKKKEENIKNGE